MVNASVQSNQNTGHQTAFLQAFIAAAQNNVRHSNSTNGQGSEHRHFTDCTGTYCVDFGLADSNDGYTRDWAIFYTSPGTYLGSGAWTNTSPACYYSSISSGANESCNSMSTSTYLYYCVSVPDTGFSPGYSGYAYLYHSVALIAAYYPSGITENNCYQGTGL